MDGADSRAEGDAAVKCWGWKDRYYDSVMRSSRKKGCWQGAKGGGGSRPGRGRSGDLGRQVARKVGGASVVILAAGLVGCADPDKNVSFAAADPASRIRAIQAAGQAEDPAAIPDLIETLDSDDPMQRMLAIRMLERMTGQTLGYDHAAPFWERNKAVERWVAWAHEEGLAPRPRSADESEAAPVREGGTEETEAGAGGGGAAGSIRTNGT